jgi:hypothetical protein
MCQLALWAAASGGNKSMEKIETPVERIVIAVADDLVDQGESAYWDLPEVAGCAFLPYSAWASETFGAAWQLHFALKDPDVLEKLGTLDSLVEGNQYLAESLPVLLGWMEV